MKTTAILSEDGTTWVLNGEKQWITNAGIANCYVVFAKAEKGITAFIVERELTGVSIGPEEKKMGINGSSTATLVLEDVHVAAENMLGEDGKGHYIALNILNMARLKLAFANVGTSKRALQLAIEYANVRKQFNKALTEFTMIQEKIADMTIGIYGAESAVYRTAGLMDDALAPATTQKEVMKVISSFMADCAVNKVNSSEVLDFTVDEAVQIHGGYGYMQEYEVENLYRDARINRIFEGTNEINRLAIAKGVLKKAVNQNIPYTLEDNLTYISKLQRALKYLIQTKQVLNNILKALPNTFEETAKKEQEYLRLLADMYSKMYMMESAFSRTKKAIIKNGEENEAVKIFMTDVLCEEGFQNVKNNAILFIAGDIMIEKERERLIAEVQGMPVPFYSNLFLKKRIIAKNIIEHGKYSV